MPETPGRWRPEVDQFERDGWHLLIVDFGQILAAATRHPVELMTRAAVPAQIQRVRMMLSTQDGAIALNAFVHSGRSGRTRQPYFTALGHGPLGAILQRRVDAGDQRAQRVVSGLQTAVAGLNRLMTPGGADPGSEWAYGRPLRSEIVIDEESGLRTTLTDYAPPSGPPGHRSGGERDNGDLVEGGGRIVELRAAVPAGAMAPIHLAAFFGVFAQLIGDITGQRVDGTFTLGGQHMRASGSVTLDQVGGLDDVVAQFRDVAASFRHPQAMARWGARRPQGILLYGPPGTGKTMLAQALATEIGGTLREIRTPDILDKWLGASERNLKAIFQQARQLRTPTVLLFDEFDSIIGYAGAGDDSGSRAVNAVAGIFKQEMNNLIDENPYVIVVATTNFPDAIDASLTRSGRFDIKLAIPAPDARGRAQILTRMMRGLIAEHEADGFRMFADDVDVDELAARGDGLAGADLNEVLRRAQMVKAMQEARSGTTAGPITQADLRVRLDEVRASRE